MNEHKLEDAKISSQNWDLKWVTFVCVQRDSSYMGRVALGRLVISTVGVALALELGSSPHPSLPFTPCRPTLLKHNVTYGNDKVVGTIFGGHF